MHTHATINSKEPLILISKLRQTIILERTLTTPTAISARIWRTQQTPQCVTSMQPSHSRTRRANCCMSHHASLPTWASSPAHRWKYWCGSIPPSQSILLQTISFQQLWRRSRTSSLKQSDKDNATSTPHRPFIMLKKTDRTN